VSREVKFAYNVYEMLESLG